ncbi:hypothetical protein CP967_19310 [Streptomyces nitrosporeus]|uniref:DUF5667 domain-containing protein n=1 Tax=Streptomyces nitrosporeus TaxID=28894 RepID=A0A5J6FC47_9ACTN|nr:DUF5667 domain-containing protein [Streptomyces nitrosporeus]QEU73852.1 hypothetical protein CP967_19310 [Streptomyces nitrosporeus]GGZ26128.1 hypothetical protein GCM10010327_66000 [Streptomyces nitrosporeus]
MIANVSAHRRANAFAQALEEQPSQGAAAGQPDEPAAPAEHGPLLALANGLGELPKPELDPEVKTVQRAQLVAAMETMFAQGGASTGPTVPEQRSKGAHRASPLRKLRPRSRWAKGLTAGGITVGVAAGAFGGVAAASSDALPGDSLYALKRGMEDIHLGMANGDADRGEVYLDQASTRLSEARRLMERARAGQMDHESLGEVRRTLNGMTHDATEGHRLLRSAYQRDGSLGPIQTLDTFSRAHRDSWSDLRDRLPVQLADIGEQVSSVFEAMDEEVAPLQSLLPRTPGKGEETERSGSRQGDAGPSDTERPAPSSPAAPGPGEEGADTSPQPSGTGEGPGEGLIGGGTSGLLDGLPTDAATPSAPSGGTGQAPPVPDVTLPPLLPGLLPGLGLGSEDLEP